MSDSSDVGTSRTLVLGARGLNVAGLLALVADLLSAGRLLGAIAGEMTILTTVVALAAIDTLACR